jgi:hypothetical protein
LLELRRVARRRVGLFNADPAESDRFWLTVEYLPGFPDLIPARYRVKDAWQREVEQSLEPVRLITAPIPHDRVDKFCGAFWRRPAAYPDPSVRDEISVFSGLNADDVTRAIRELDADVRTGTWHERHPDIRNQSELHLGYYVVTAELS